MGLAQIFRHQFTGSCLFKSHDGRAHVIETVVQTLHVTLARYEYILTPVHTDKLVFDNLPQPIDACLGFRTDSHLYATFIPTKPRLTTTEVNLVTHDDTKCLAGDGIDQRAIPGRQF